jgi:ABC-type lipoprotein export system ATPase subunit
MSAIVDARDLVREYRMGAEMVHALRGVSLAVHEREYVAIVGPSGCGKSTLLNLLGVIDRPTSGELSIAGERVDRLSDARATEFRLRRIGFVFQRFYLMQALSARENVELPLSEAGSTTWGCGSASAIVRRSSREASSSASPSHARSPTGPRCSSPTSRPASSMRAPARR